MVGATFLPTRAFPSLHTCEREHETWLPCPAQPSVTAARTPSGETANTPTVYR